MTQTSQEITGRYTTTTSEYGEPVEAFLNRTAPHGFRLVQTETITIAASNDEMTPTWWHRAIWEYEI